MRILYFSRSYTPHDHRFLGRMAGSEHDVWYLRLEGSGTETERRPLPDRVHELAPLSVCPVRRPSETLALMEEFSQLVRRLAPDLIHAGPVQTCGLMAARAGFRPLVLMSWGSDILMDADRDQEWLRSTVVAINGSDRLVCDCDAVRKKVQKLTAYPEDRFVQFPWGVELERFRPADPSRSALRQQLEWTGKKVILSLRSWEPVYGIEVLLESFRLAFTADPSLRLILAGGGSLAEVIGQKAERWGLGDAIHRPGIVAEDELAKYFDASDMYVSCSYSDGSSVSLLQAMASGLPVVASDIAGNREWITPGVNGLLPEAGNAHAFAAAILRTARSSAAERLEVRKKNRAVVEHRADWEANSGRLFESYRDLLCNSGK